MKNIGLIIALMLLTGNMGAWSTVDTTVSTYCGCKQCDPKGIHPFIREHHVVWTDLGTDAKEGRTAAAPREYLGDWIIVKGQLYHVEDIREDGFAIYKNKHTDEILTGAIYILDDCVG